MQEKGNGQVVIAASREQRGLSSWGRFLLVVFSVVVSFAFCEVAFRLFWHNPYRYEAPERVLRLPIHHARTDHVLDRSVIGPEQPTVHFRTDERSYIMPSRRFEIPDATVAFLGGSTTECKAVQEELRFPAHVSYLIEKKGLKVNTLNAGKSGNSTHDSINVLLNHIVEDKPDVVVLMEASNDIGVLQNESYRSRMGETESFSHAIRFGLQKASSTLYFMGIFRKWATSEKPRSGLNFYRWRGERREKAQIPRDEPKRHLSAFVRSNRDDLVTSTRRDEYEGRLRAFVRISRAFSIAPVLMTQPVADIRNAFTPDWVDARNQDVFNHIIRKVSADEGAILIDLMSHVVENVEGWNQPMKIFYDGVHVTDRGSEVYAEYIAARLYDEMLVRGLSR